jgi:WD40 repeat protein
MTQHDDLFSPEEVDEQIDRLSRSLDEHGDRRNTTLALRLVRDLRRRYRNDAQEDARSLARAWGRIARQSDSVSRQEDGREPSIDVFADQQESMRHRMQKNIPVSSRWQTAQRRIGMVAAIVFLAILVGSLVVVLNIAHRGTTTGHAGNQPSTTGVLAKPSATAPAPSANIGKIVYTRHEQQYNDVYQLAWSPDSTRIADANDFNFESWDALTGKHNLIYLDYGGFTAQWSPDGSHVASSAIVVYIWDASTGKLLLTYAGQQSGLTPTPTPGPGTPTPTPTPVPPVTPTPSPSANSVSGRYADADILSPNQQQVPGSGGNAVRQNVWSPDGRLMASAFSGPGYGNVIYVWNTTTGKTLLTYRGHSDYITALAWSPNGKYIASCDASGTTQIWSASTGKLLVKLPVNAQALAWSPDSARLATGSNNVQVWNAMTGRLLLTYQNSFQVETVAWSPDGTRIAAGDAHIQIFDAQTGKTIYTFIRNPNLVRTLAWSPNGKYIASATGPGESGPVEIQVWIAS